MAEEERNQKLNEGYIKLKLHNLEIEISGSELFVEKMFKQSTEYVETEVYTDDEIEELTTEDEDEIVDQESSEIADQESSEIETIPLDQYLANFDISTPQKKTLATAIFLSEVKKKTEFKGRDINSILKLNKLAPIVSISTHIRRLRSKGLISIKSSPGKELTILIYKDSIIKGKEFLKK